MNVLNVNAPILNAPIGNIQINAQVVAQINAQLNPPIKISVEEHIKVQEKICDIEKEICVG